MKWEYVRLSVEKSGKGYKPVVFLKTGKIEKTYRFFCAADAGLSNKDDAINLGIKNLRAGRFG